MSHNPAPGSTSLSHLLSTLTVTLHPTTYVFLSLPSSQFIAPFPIPLSSILLFFREPPVPSNSSTTTPTATTPSQPAHPPPASSSPSTEEETITLIIPLSVATSHSLLSQSIYPSRMITLNVQSSLEAVGFMAAVSQALAEAEISMNPVSGVFHDHLFVPVEEAERAVEVLEKLATKAGTRSGGVEG